MSVSHFINQNLVAIIMVPGIIGAHYGWKYLQEQDSLVKPEERKGMPLMEIMQKLVNNFKGDDAKKAE